MISMAERRHDETISALAHAWRATPDPAALASTCTAEHIRSILYGAVVSPGNAAAPRTVHTTRLLSSARRVVELMWPQLAPRARADQKQASSDLCSKTLERMAVIGDAVSLQGGQWLAAPLRLVADPAGASFLLVGGAPSDAANARLGSSPTAAAASRFVADDVVRVRENQELVCSIGDWLGNDEPLDRWTANLLSRHEARMEPAHGVSAEQLEVYAPDVARNKNRQGWWIPAWQIDQQLKETRLCRPLQAFARNYDRPSMLVQFTVSDGRLTIRRSVALDRKLEYRLSFGFDLRFGVQRRVALAVSQTQFIIDRPLSLPQPERRVYALGWDAPQPGAHPDRLFFGISGLPFVLQTLARLNVRPIITNKETR